MFRSQVSLMINDEKLYTDFIKPLSNERQLMPLIVKLLSSYYYNEDTRIAVDGTSISSQKEQSEYVSDDNRELQEKLADIRASAQLLGMFVQDSKATLEEGMEAVNNIARATGGTVSRETENGMSVPRISMKGIDALHSEVQSAQVSSAVAGGNESNSSLLRDPRVDDLKKDVEEVKNDISKILSILQGVSILSLERSENNESLDIHTLVPTDEQKIEPVSDSEIVSEPVETVIDEPKPIVEHDESTDEEQEAGRSQLKSMLLGGGVGGFL